MVFRQNHKRPISEVCVSPNLKLQSKLYQTLLRKKNHLSMKRIFYELCPKKIRNFKANSPFCLTYSTYLINSSLWCPLSNTIHSGQSLRLFFHFVLRLRFVNSYNSQREFLPFANMSTNHKIVLNWPVLMILIYNIVKRNP